VKIDVLMLILVEKDIKEKKLRIGFVGTGTVMDSRLEIASLCTA